MDVVAITRSFLSSGGGLLQKDQESLEDLVGESRSDADVLDQPLEVVDEDEGEGGLVSLMLVAAKSRSQNIANITRGMRCFSPP